MRLTYVLKILKRNIPVLRHLGVKTLALFGSTARNDAISTSDVDILVTFTYPRTFDQYMETKFYLEDLLDCKVDLVIQDELKPLVRAEMEKEAVYIT